MILILTVSHTIPTMYHPFEKVLYPLNILLHFLEMNSITWAAFDLSSANAFTFACRNFVVW